MLNASRFPARTWSLFPMPKYRLPCPVCGPTGGGDIELDTDCDNEIECDLCQQTFEWRWFGKGNLVLYQDERIPMFLYPGVGQFQESTASPFWATA